MSDRAPRATRGGRAQRPPQSREVLISKALSRILRHSAQEDGLVIDANGWVESSALLQHKRLRSLRATMADVEEVVASNNKKRFETETRGDLVYLRAVQGHSIENVTDLGLVRLAALEDFPPGVHHGTFRKTLPVILELGGLSRMNRNHIHLTRTAGTQAPVSGRRTGTNVFIYIDVAKCLAAGIEFYVSSNGAILTPGNADGMIPKEFFADIKNV